MSAEPPDSAMPAGRVGRMVRPAALGARSAAGHAGTWLANRFRATERRDQATLDRYVRTAEQAAGLMGEMKGAVMKLGQLLSFADLSMVPPEFQDLLASLQADAPPMAWDLVAGTVQDELGGPPAELFARFSPEPIAAASIGQVHAATTHDGREVVVKVQYPGVAAAIDADLRNTALLSNLAVLAQAAGGSLMPKSDIRAIVEELRDRVLEELDYRREAANQQRFADLYRGHPWIRIPEVVPELSTGRVLTQDYHDGMRFPAARREPAELRDRWAEVIWRFVFGSLYRHHVFNADPHPGNYLFHEDGGVTFLDFGCVRDFTGEQVAQMQALGEAALAADPETFRQRVVDIGFLRADDRVDTNELWEFSSHSYEPITAPQPFTFSKAWATEAVARQTGLALEWSRLVRAFRLPPHFLFLGRITLGVASILTALEATGEWRSIEEELWRGAPPRTDIGRQAVAAGFDF